MPSNALSWQDDPSGYISSAVGLPVQITSGFRTPQRNAAVGGVPNSAHLSGTAFDFVPQGGDMAGATSRIVQSGIPFDQVINEGDHVHVSFAPTNRRQVIGNMSSPGISDDDLLKALTGGGAPTSSAASPAPAQSGASDEQILAALTGGKAASATASKAAPAKSSAASPGVSKPFGFADYVTSKIPFAQDAVAAGTAGLDTLANTLTGTKGPSFGDAYHANLNQLQANQQAYEQAHPILSTAGTGLSFVAGAKPVGIVAGAGQTLGQIVKEGAKGGALLGGLFGAGTPTGQDETLGDRALNAAVGTGAGALTGGAVPLAGAGVAQVLRGVGKATNKLFPSIEQSAATKARGIIENFAGGPVQPSAAEIIPGSKPTLAEATGNPGVAALTRAVRDLNPNSPLIAREGQNAAARQAFVDNLKGTPEQLDAAIDARNKAGDAARESAFAQSAGKSADTLPVTDKIQETLTGSSGNRPAVKSAMADVQKMMVRDDGTPITDPKTLYDSVRKGINDLIGGKDLNKSYGQQAASELIAVRDKLDNAIESGAPGFKQYLEDYSSASSPIDAMKFLQGQDLTDAQGKIHLGKVQTALKRLTAQQAAPGAKAAKNVTDDQVQALENLRDDLLRAKNIELGKSIGSNTVQNAMAQQRMGLSRFIPEGLGATGGTALGGMIAGAHGAELGGVLGDRLGSFAGGIINNRRQMMNNLVQSNVEDMLLNPGRYQNPTRPSQLPTLNDILNDARTRTAIRLGNNLAVLHHLGRKNLNAAGAN